MKHMDRKDAQVCLSFLQVWGRIKSHLAELAIENGITMPQAFMLYHLYTQDRILMGNLAKHLHCDASNITGMVDRLEAQGLIERHEMQEDRRAKQLRITKKGRKFVEKILARLPERMGFNSFTKAELDTLHALLGKLSLQETT